MPQFQLFTGDAESIAETLTTKIDALVSDPPYGCDLKTNYTRFTKGKSDHRNDFNRVRHDDQPFDPSPWLTFPKVVLFGWQFFGSKLPAGTSLVWLKKRDHQLGTFLSDAEIAWQKGGKGCYVFRHVWNGFDRESEKGQKSLHPCQKPVALFRWVLNDRLKLKPGDTVLDPFCGSGSCGVAALELGLNYIGIDLEDDYVSITRNRLIPLGDEVQCLAR